jgi:hypothetical protein
LGRKSHAWNLRTISLPSNQGQVLGVNLNCSESGRALSQPDYKESTAIKYGIKYGRSLLLCGISIRSALPPKADK